MNCYICNQKLIWNNDFSTEEYGIEKEGIVTVLSCSNDECEVETVEVYRTHKKEKNESSSKQRTT
jgi:hypothetical protein